MPGHKPLKMPLPKSWTSHVRSAMLHVISLVQFATAYTRSWAANSINARIRLKAELDRAIDKAETVPKYIICDKDSIFWCAGFKGWCRRRGIKSRFGAVGQHGSIAVVERAIRTLKDECIRQLGLVSYHRRSFRRELELFIDWYNEFRPHGYLEGSTPNEVYFSRRPAHRRPRFEPRPKWPRGLPCAAPRTLVAGQPGVRVELEVRFHGRRKHLPVVRLKRAA